MRFALGLLLPSILGLAVGLLAGGADGSSMEYFSNTFFFAGMANILYSGALLAASLGAFRVLSYGFSLLVRLLFSKRHAGGEKLTHQFLEWGGAIDPVYFWPQAAIGAAFIALSATLAVLI